MGQYADQVMRQLICAWKYQGDMSAWEILRRRLGPKLALMELRIGLAGVKAVVPVPLNYQRRAERGFDQAEEIANWIGERLKLPVLPLLRRKLTNGHQAERSDKERVAAMENSPFVAFLSDNVPKIVLLVDDVWTTGATMQAAARVLAEQNIESRFLTLAKG